ncbi:MAG: HlyD family efflux transporter periplasmic adaptor subunit [Acidobacteria bacterium]|nr:HlyD family efflux transporter periplasmic adaptor subunit [Acidobacteriota bacterium]
MCPVRTLTWNEDHTVSIGVVATGKVIHVYSKVGDKVKNNHMLAKMHTHDVHDTKALLRSACAERDRATSALEQAKRNEERTRRLLQLKAVSTSQLEQAVLDRKTAETALRKANADVDKEIQHLTETLEIGAEDEEDPKHKHDEEEELVPIKSTADGIIVDRKITPGTVVTLGQEAFIVSDPASLWCIANFPEVSLSRIHVGAVVEIEVRAYPGRRFSGRITRLGETIDPNTRTLLVRADLNTQGVLKPEMLATIRLRLPAAPSLVVPESALQVVDGKTTVFVESAPGKFFPRSIEAQVINGRAVILAGLKEGERVAANGSYFLKGQLLREAGL